MFGRLGTGVLPGVIMLCGGIAAWTGSLQPGQAMAAEPKQETTLRLQCPAEAPEPEALCAALATALQDTLDGSIRIRTSQIPASAQLRALPVPEQPDGAGTIRLVLTSTGADRLHGHLEWQSGTAPPRQGPEVALDVMDATLSATMYPDFARGLIQITPELAATWARKP